MTIIIASDPTGPTKRTIIERAFGMMAMHGYEFGRSAEEVTYALGELDSLMAEWEADGIGLGYAYTDDPSNDAEASGIQMVDLNGVVCGLVQALASAHGKTLPPEAMGRISRSISSLRAGYATIPTMPIAYGTPRGMGNRTSLGPFINETP